MSNEPQATTSIEAPAADNIWGRLWGNKLVKEFYLLLVSTVAVQFAFGFNDLYGAVDSAESWSDLLQSGMGWFNAFSFALVISIVKQSLAFGTAKLAKTQL